MALAGRARKSECAGGWLVLVDSKVAQVAGVGGVDMTGLDTINADEALKWVELIAALYVRASGK
ncbi:hypothetical protein [Mycobacterium paraintracellulare]|uniref:hypothetical protein n=1 Tax=Mycobacterium paraintracellulare TaxID=1138383 RepID=UPI0019271928|nr:hypothetical protein [Mycobacterium paraintracellulare]BCP13989.1 hypothetical protein MINTM021_08980 [Mycobacterium paraintracellulare]